MTTAQLLASQIDETGFQFQKLLEGLKEEERDAKTNPATMSIREQLAHICECYTYVAMHAEGGKYEWGTQLPATEDWDALVAEFYARRALVAPLASKEDEALIPILSGFVVAHDNYHVGQMAAIRIASDATWDPYSIYRFGA